MEVELLQFDSTLHITVADSGDGVAPDLADQIFLEGTSTKPASDLPGGRGIGLHGQIDVGWSAPPLAYQPVMDGKTRMLVPGRDIVAFRSQSIRVIAANAAAGVTVLVKKVRKTLVMTGATMPVMVRNCTFCSSVMGRPSAISR